MRATYIFLYALTACSVGTCASAAQHKRPIGEETTIPFASNGGIRNWQADRKDDNVVYVQDRTLHWFRIDLTGPCVRIAGDPMTIRYTTDNSGTFDKFSRLTFPNSRDTSCGVKSIKTSLPPPGQPGALRKPH